MKKLLSVCLTTCVLVFSSASVQAKGDQIQLRDGHPEEYVVVKGDTLWDISGRFLKKPWRWPEIWDVNKQIDDPHWIYPGDVLYLTWVDGKPKLRKKGNDRLQPRARVSKIENAIPAIPLKDLHSFLSDNAVLDDELLKTTPYVVGGRNERIIAGAGDRIYARGELDSSVKTQNIYRPAKEYIDRETGELLGYELHKVAETRVISTKEDVISLDVLKTREEVRVLDRVLPSPEGRVQSVFNPAPAPEFSEGYIMSVLRGVDKIGRFDAVAINQGFREGVQAGHVYKIFKRGESLKDPLTKETIELPSEEAGTLMVFKAYERVSYGLVMTATNVMSVGDKVRSPDAQE